MTQKFSTSGNEANKIVWALNATLLEKKAIAFILIDIAKADGKISIEENNLFNKLQQFIGISYSECKEALSMDIIDCANIIKMLPPSIKEIVAEMMIEMIIIDKHVAEEEFKAVYKICQYCEIPIPKISV
jgi:uncharacterized tellurite resistance protein B-like protein